MRALVRLAVSVTSERAPVSRAGGRRWWQLPSGLLARVQAAFLLAAISNSLALIPVVATSEGGPPLVRLMTVIVLAVLVVVWVKAARRGRFLLAEDVVAGVILFVLGLTVNDPLRGSAVVYVGLFYRALFGSGRNVAVGSTMQLLGFAVALTIRNMAGTLASEPGDYLLQLPAVGLVGLMYLLAVTLARHEQAADRERSLARAGAALVACSEAEEVYDAALEGIWSLVAPYKASVGALAVLDQDELSVVRSIGTDAHILRDLRLQVTEGAGWVARFRERFAGSGGAVPALYIGSLLVRGDLRGTIVAATPRPLPTDCADGLTTLGSEVALALETIGLRHAAEEQAADMRTILDQLGDSLVVVGTDGQIRMANAAAGALVGLPSDKLIGLRPDEQPWSVLRADGSPTPQAERPLDSVLQGRPVSGEYLFVGVDGQRRWVWEEATLLRSTTGVVRGAISLARETTERRVAQEALRLSEERYRRIVETTQEGICQLDLSGRIVYANQRLGELLDYSIEDLQGRTVTDFLSVEPGGPGAAQLEACLRNDEKYFEARFSRKDGHSLWVRGVVDSILDAAGVRSGMLAMLTDITERKQAEAALLHQAQHDPLTDLPNRTLFQDRLQQAIAVADRDHRSLALLVLDLDRFKEVNDTFGHHTGDRLLRTVAENLRRTLRASDTVARLGGDEFAVIMSGADVQAGTSMADKLGRTLQRQQLLVAGHGLSVEVSVGIATYPTLGETAELLIQHADAAMYFAKRTGTRHAVYDAQQKGPHTRTAGARG